MDTPVQPPALPCSTTPSDKQWMNWQERCQTITWHPKDPACASRRLQHCHKPQPASRAVGKVFPISTHQLPEQTVG